MGVLVKPLITEKAAKLSEDKGQYGFVAKVDATKPEIKAEIERMYGVEVVKIRTLIVAGKKKSRFTKSGMSIGKTSRFKKAIVSLKDDQTIDFYESV